MKNTKLILALALLGTLSACAMKQKVLDTGAVSMTLTSLAPGQKLHDVGPVTGEFCSNGFSDKGSIGLIDEAVKAAQTKHSVDMITNASFYTNGNGCMTVEGTGQKLTGTTVSSDTTDIKEKAPKRR